MRTGENIYKRKDGRWEARYRRGRTADGRILYGSCYGKTYTEAKNKAADAAKKMGSVPEINLQKKDRFAAVCNE